MKEHKEKRHKRSSRDRELSDPPRKIVKREPRSSSESSEDHERQRRKKQHHSKHHHTYEEASHSSSRLREDRGKEKDRDRRRAEQFKIKKEPVDINDIRESAEPSSSRWDEDDDKNHHKSRFRPDSRDGRGRGRGRGRGGFHGNKRPFRPEEEDTSNMEWGKKSDNSGKQSLPPAERDKPNFGLSGKLTEDTNTYKGVVIKYSEPPEARVPKRRWRLYPFKGDEALKVLHVHRASAFLMGRERKVVDIPLDHPSCSKQHAALQFRLVQYTRENGSIGKRIWPYIIDLDSANGTFVNNNKIEPRKYVELLERDVLKFGFSSREYVLLHEHSKDDDEDDDV